MHTGGGDLAGPVVDANVVIASADTHNKWRRLLHMKKYCGWMVYASLGVVMLGFDWSCYPQLLAIPGFAERYGSWDPAQKLYIVPSGRQGAWNGSSSAAQVVGGLISGWVMDRIGRRYWLLFLSCLGVISIAIVYASPNWKVLCAGRLIQGFSIGGMTTFTPVYIGENSVPELRGFFLVSFNTFIVVGQFLITLVNRGTNTINGNWSWKIPILTMFIYPSIVILLWPWFPESPYWLISKKRDEEKARQALLKLYGSNRHDIVEAQILRIKSSITTGEVLMKTEREGRFLDVFKGKNFKRTFAAIFASGSQQFIGVIFVVGYIPYFLTLSGITNPFNWTMYLFTINLLGNIVSFWTVERFGRRHFVVYGLLILGVVNLIIGALNVNVSHGKLLATIALTYIWAFVYQTTIGALGFTLASEVATISLRSETQSLVTVANAGFGWVFSFSIPFMINPDAAHLGGKIGFIFGSFSLVCFAVGWYIFPETKGFTFAELDWLYANGTPCWRFKSTMRQKRAEGYFDAPDNDSSMAKGGEVHVEHTESARV